MPGCGDEQARVQLWACALARKRFEGARQLEFPNCARVPGSSVKKMTVPRTRLPHALTHQEHTAAYILMNPNELINHERKTYICIANSCFIIILFASKCVEGAVRSS